MRAVCQVMGPPQDDGNGVSFNTSITVSTDQLGTFGTSATLNYADTAGQMNAKLLTAVKQAAKDLFGYTVQPGDTLVTFNKAT